MILEREDLCVNSNGSFIYPDKLLCTKEEVYNILRILDVLKSNGHDDINISTWILKEKALSMTSIVDLLFNISIEL